MWLIPAHVWVCFIMSMILFLMWTMTCFPNQHFTIFLQLKSHLNWLNPLPPLPTVMPNIRHLNALIWVPLTKLVLCVRKKSELDQNSPNSVDECRDVSIASEKDFKSIDRVMVQSLNADVMSVRIWVEVVVIAKASNQPRLPDPHIN